MKYSDISPNFVTHTITDRDSIRNSIKNLILIKKHSLMGNVRLGSRVTGYIFKNMNLADKINLELEIKSVLKNYESRIKVEGVQIVMTDNNELYCNIFYSVLDNFDTSLESVRILLEKGASA